MQPFFIQRCSTAVVREVVSQLPREDRSDSSSGHAGQPEGDGRTLLTRAAVRNRIRDAYDLGRVAGTQALNMLADRLEQQGVHSAASTLRASLRGLFTVDRLGFQPPLNHALSTTHAITQARFGLPRQICRPPTWQDSRMALQWSIASFRATIEGRRRIAGFWQLAGLATR